MPKKSTVRRSRTPRPRRSSRNPRARSSRSTPSTRPPFVASDFRAFLTLNEPAQVTTALNVLDSLNWEFQDNGTGPEGSRYRRLYARVLERIFAADPTTGRCHRGLLSMDDFIPVEEAIRQAGFVQGFITCSLWLAGAVNVPTVDDVRRGAR